MEIRYTRLAPGAIGVCLVMLLGSPAAQPGWALDPAFGLGRAAEFAVLSLGKPSAETDGQSKLDLSQVTIHGDVGVGPFGTLDFQGPSWIEGELYLDLTLEPQDILTDEGTVTGGRESVDTDRGVAKCLDSGPQHWYTAHLRLDALDWRTPW